MVNDCDGAFSSQLHGRKRNQVQISSFDDNTSKSGDSNDESIVVSPQRRNRITRHNASRWEDESSSDEGSPCFVRSYKRVKCADDYNGWLETSTLKAVAARYGGTASQFRVVRGVAHVKDSATKTMIPPGSLIVQSRFASAAGNVGGHSYMFLNWKLPGKENRHSLYKHRRPGFHDAGTPLNAHPSITLESDLHPAVKAIITTFLREAEAGMTPIDFFDNGEGPELSVLVHDDCDLPPVEIDHYALKAATAQVDDIVMMSDAHPKGDSERQNYTSNKATHDDADNDAGSAAFDDDIDSPAMGHVHASAVNDKSSNALGNEVETDDRSWFQVFTGPLLGTKKRKIYGGPKPRSPAEASFFVNTSTSNQSIVLIEGLVEPQNSTVTASCDYLRDVFMDGRVDCLPSKGRLVDLLPNVAHPGPWQATIVDADGNKRHASGLIRGSMQASKCARIVLRHASVRDLGMLSDNAAIPTPGSTTRQVHVSSIDPAISRRKDFQSQGVVVNDVDPLVVGSISIVVCEGCSSWSEANSERAGELASGFLFACKDKASELSVNGMCRIADVENLLPIPDMEGIPEERGVSANVGVSYLCKLTSKDAYRVLVGQDNKGRTVAVDGKFWRRSHPTSFITSHMLGPVAVVLDPKAVRLSKISSRTGSTIQGPKLNASNIERFAKEAPELNVLSYPDGLLGDNQLIDGARARSHMTAVMSVNSPPYTRFAKEKCMRIVPTRASKNDRADRPSMVTPIMAMREKLAVDTLSPLPPVAATLATLPIVTPFARRDRQDSKCDAAPLDRSLNQRDQYTAQQGQAYSEKDLSDDQWVFEDRSDSGWCNVTAYKSPITVRDRRTGIRYLLFSLVLLAFCLKIPKQLSQTVVCRGHHVLAETTSTVHDLFAEKEVVRTPIGYSIIGSESVSLVALALVAVIFGSS